MTNRTKWLISIPFSLLVSILIPGLVVWDAWWFIKTPACLLFAALSFGMWIVATAFVNVEKPRGDRDLANLLMPLALILVVPLAVYDHARGLAASMPASIIWIGILFSALSILLGLLSRLYLGRSYSPSPYRRIEDAFVQTGPYRWIRHPLYTAALFWVIGWPLILCSFRSVFLALALIIPAIIKRVQTEETEMLRQFGAEYENYCTKTCRFIPFIY